MAGGSDYITTAAAQGLYGLPATLPAGCAAQASASVDAYLKRPEGMVYVADKNGAPAYMKALTPSIVYTVTSGAIAPGANVVVTVSPAIVRPDLVGEVLIINKDTANELEAVVVSGTLGNNQLTLSSVQFAHAASATLSVGLVISEERSVPTKRSITRYSRFPCANILSLMGRYAYGRRSDQVGGLYQEMNLLAAVQTFGGPPQWLPIAVNQASWSDATGEIWVPAGMLLAYYSDVKFKYVAGFPSSALPDEIIEAAAMVAKSMIAAGAFGGNVQTVAAGDTRITRFNASYVDEDVKKLLSRFKARLFF